MLQNLGNLGELFGALATVAMLLYVGLEIRHSTSRAKREALEQSVERIVRWGSRLGSNEELLQIYLDGQSEYQMWDTARQWRFHFILIEILTAYEAILEHSKVGGIKAETVAAVDGGIVRELTSLGARSWWRDMGRSRLAPDFAAHIDDLIGEAA